VETAKPHVLVVSDEESVRFLIAEHLTREGFEVESAADAERAIKKLSLRTYDVLVTDLMLAGNRASGLGLLEETLVRSRDTVVILMTDHHTIEYAVEAMKRGVYDYVTKPFKLIELPTIIRKGLNEAFLRRENQYLQNQLREKYCFDNIIGTGSAMRQILEVVETVAGLTSTCLIQGEPGTGKKLIAKTIHFNSPRRNQRLVTINCRAIPEQLLEAALFGHAKDALTGAVQTRIGRFEEADHGTILLDEIGNMPLTVQMKLLHVLQQCGIEGFGETGSRLDVRIIAASSANLERMVAEGTFREDLYYRLKVIPINLPPLRERREDIPLLIQTFVQQFCKDHNLKSKTISPQVMKALMSFEWPGNIQQLQNTIERMAALTGNRTSILLSDLPPQVESRSAYIAGPFVELPAEGIDFQNVVTDMERELILQSLRRTNGNKKLAAKLLSLKRTTLIEKIKRIGLN
jgi:DNA-binding NtrC family response regulator